MSASAMGLMGGVHQNRALLATGTTLLVAYSNHSISGALFLLAFLWWGACCISTPYAASSYKQHKRVWTATAAAALLLFILQLLAQLLYGLHLLPATTSDSHGDMHLAMTTQAHGSSPAAYSNLRAASAAGQLAVNRTTSAWQPDGEAYPAAALHIPANSTASITAIVLEAMGLGSMEGLPVGYILLLLSAALFCLLAATAEAAEARQVMSALRAAPPQVVTRSTANQPGSQTLQDQQAAPAAASAGCPAHPPAASHVLSSGVHASGAAGRGCSQPLSSVGPAPSSLRDSRVAVAVDAAVVTSVAAFAPQLSVPLTLGLQCTNSGALTAMFLLWVAVLWPSCLNAVYLLVVLWGLLCWAWGSTRTWTSAPWAVLLQAFTGTHLMALYLSQLPLLQLPSLDLPFDILGLYKLSADPALDPTRAVFATQVAHLVLLHLLYAALGFYTALLRQPQYQQLAASIRNAGRGRVEPQGQQGLSWAPEQAGWRQSVSRQDSSAPREVTGHLSPAFGGLDDLLAPLLGPMEQQQAQQQQLRQELSRHSMAGPKSPPLAQQQQQEAAGAEPADGVSGAAAGANSSVGVPSDASERTSLSGVIQMARQHSSPTGQQTTAPSSLVLASLPGAASASAAAPVPIRGSVGRAAGATSSTAGGAILPGTSVRGLLRGERQDWGPIQRFIAEADDNQAVGGSHGAMQGIASSSGSVAGVGGAVASAALAAATGAAAAAGVASLQGGSSSAGRATATDAEEAAVPVLLPGGRSPEPFAAGRGSHTLLSTLQHVPSPQTSTDFSPSAAMPAAPGAATGATAVLGGGAGHTGAWAEAFSGSAGVGPSYLPAGGPGTSAAAVGGVMSRWEQVQVVLQVLLPFLVSCGEYLLLQLLAAPAVAGIAIAGFALVQVSVVGCATLILSLWSLLAPSWAGRRIFTMASPYIMLAYVIWLLDDYVATALDGIVTPPPVLDSIGIWGYRQPFPALLPLLLHLLTTLAVAGLSRNHVQSRGSKHTAGTQAAAPAAAPAAAAAAGTHGDSGGADTVGQEAQEIRASHAVAIPGRDIQGGSPIAAAIVSFGARMSYSEVPFISSLPTLLRSRSLQTPSNDVAEASESAAAQRPSSAVQAPQHAQPQQQRQQQQQQQHDAGPQSGGSGPPAAAGASSPPDPELVQPWNELLGGWWHSLGTGAVQLLWLLGRLGVPTACVVLAGSQADVLHGVYLLIMLLYLLVSCTGLQPLPPAVPLWWEQYACSSSRSPAGRMEGGNNLQSVAENSDATATGQHSCRNPTKQQQQEPHALPAAQLPQHRLLRLYGSCHLMVVYLALVLQLPGLESELNEYILRLVGLWDPKILSDLLPVLLLLVAATIHVILGKWLLTRAPAGATWPTAAGSAAPTAAAPAVAAAAAGAGSGGSYLDDARQSALDWLQAVYAKPVLRLLLAGGGLACSVGAALLVLLGYLLLLWDTPVGLLGAVYLLLLVAILMLPPELQQTANGSRLDRSTAVQSQQQPAAAHRQRRGGSQRSAGQAAAAGPDEEWQLYEPLLEPSFEAAVAGPEQQQPPPSPRVGLGGEGGRARSALRWVLPALLAMLCAVDLSVQYALVVGALVQERPLLPPAVAEWIRDVVGIDDTARGTALLVALLRPTLLMAGLAVYRFLYGIGTLSTSHLSAPQTQSSTVLPAEQPSGTAATTTAGAQPVSAPVMHLQAIELVAQQSWGWLLRRLLIRHIDMLLGTACFAAALQAPSAVGLVLASGTLITALQHGFANYSSAMAASKRWHRRAVTLTRSNSGSTAAGNAGSARQQLGRQQGGTGSSPSANEQAKAFKDGCAASERSLGVLMDGITALLQVLVAAWLLAQYLLQVAWFRELLLQVSPPLLPWLLLWLGLPVAGDGATQVPGLTLEAMLRMKALVLVATALRHKAQRWQQQLPAAVVQAADAHWPCPLFWPPQQGSPAAATDGISGAATRPEMPRQAPQGAQAGQAAGAESLPWEELEPVLRRAGALVSPVKQLLFRALHQLGLITSRALAAMDLPEGTAQAIGYTFNPETYFGSSTAGPATGWPARLATWQKQLRWGAEVAVAGIRSFAEDFWERWGAECVMLLLLTAAFVGVNAVSLLFLLLVVLGMAAAASQAGGSSRGSPVTSGSGSGARRRGSGDRLSRGNSSTARSAGSSRRHSPVSWWWWHLVLGVLVVVLLVQYAAFLGPWPTQVPDVQQTQPGPNTTAAWPGAPAGLELSRPDIQHYNVSWASHSNWRQFGDGNDSSPSASGDLFQLYHSMLHPPWLTSPADSNTSTTRISFDSRSTDGVMGNSVRGEDVPTAQLLLWYFLGLAAVQPLVLWLQAAALAAVLNVLRHMPQQQLAYLLDSYFDSTGSDISAPVSSITSADGSTLQAAPANTGFNASMAISEGETSHQVFLPLSYAWRGQWTWLDWLRYRLLKHSLDILLVCVAGLCIKQKDLLHAGYLAITLLFFRQRYLLMTAPAAQQGIAVRGARLFAWLPAFNLVVMTLTLLYQAPLELLVGSSWSNTCQSEPGAAPRCSLPHLLGFCKLLSWERLLNPSPASAATAMPVSYSYGFAYGPFAGWACLNLLQSSGAVADLVLWALLRLQYKLFRSDVYSKVVACMAEEAQSNAAKQQRHWRAWYDDQARSALATSRLRLARFLRISKLKASMLEEATGGMPLADSFPGVPLPSAPATAAGAALGTSSSWPNMASASRQYPAGLPGAGSAGNLAGSGSGSQLILDQTGPATAAGQLYEVQGLLASRSVPVGQGSLSMAQQGMGSLPGARRHVRSVSDASGWWQLQQGGPVAAAVYVVPDPRMQLLPLGAQQAAGSTGMPSAAATSAGGQPAVPPQVQAAARASSTGGMPLMHRGSLDVGRRQISVSRGHSRSRSMGHELAEAAVSEEAAGTVGPGAAAEPQQAGYQREASGSLLQQQQVQVQPQHRRFGSWPTRQLQAGGAGPSRTSPTQVFSSWLYGSHPVPRASVPVGWAGPAPQQPAPSPVPARQQRQGQQPLSGPAQQQQACKAQDASSSSGSPKQGVLQSLWQWLWAAVTCLLADGSGGWEAGLCYVLFVAAFAMDFSVVSLVYLISMLVVPLLAQTPVKLYWTSMLVYTEVLLILQYSYLTAARCLCIPGDTTSSSSDSSGSGSTGCVWVLNSDPTVTRHVFELLGLHRTSAGVLPLFLIYLAVLMYNYQLSTALWQNNAASGAAQAPEATHLGTGSSAGAASQEANPAVSDRPEDGPSTASPQPEVDRSRAAAAGGAMLLMIALQGWAGQLWTVSRLLLHKLAYHVRCAALPHEWGPSWVKLDVGPPFEGQPPWASPAGAAALQHSMQAALDQLQAHDIAHELAASHDTEPPPDWLQGAATPAAAHTSLAGGGVTPQHGDVVGHMQWQAGQLGGVQELQRTGSAPEERWSQWSATGSSPDRSLPGGTNAPVHDATTLLGQQQPALIAGAADHMAPGTRLLGDASCLAHGEPGGLTRITRLVLRLDRVVTDDTSALKAPGSAVALFEVCPEPLKLQASWALPWWPSVSTQPAADAAAALCRLIGWQHRAGPQAAALSPDNWHQGPVDAMPSQSVSAPGGSLTAAGGALNLAAPEALGSVSPLLPPSRASASIPSRSITRSPARASVVFDALMGMADADVQMASRLASAVALTAPRLSASLLTRSDARASTSSAQLVCEPADSDAAAGTAQGYGVVPDGDGTGSTAACSPMSTAAGQAHPPAQEQLEGAQEQQQEQQPCPADGYDSVPILGVEHHSRPQHDYYSITALLDFVSFVYLALFYQVVMSSARSLADLTDEKQLPWDYLTALLLLFVITVVDRLVYSLGSQLGKAMLLLAQLLLFIPFCMRLFWSPVASSSSSAARQHERVFMVLKAASWVSSALQLRSGFPPRASFDGGGRQRFVFYSTADVWHLMGFYVFQAVPFLYELRALLDWTCSATPLNWYQWLKLEDIRASLFVEECRGAYRAQRSIGERVPRYIKFLQGTLLFCLLLLAIWAPLLLFSSGAPTYQTPGIVGARVNASFGVVTSYGHYQGVMSFPVFEAASRRTVENWAQGADSAGGGSGSGNSTEGLLPPDLSSYSPEQVKLICLSQDSDHLWRLSPPARAALEIVLSEPAAALHMTWTITRTAPLASGKGGPECAADVALTLAGESRQQLLEMLNGTRDWAQLMAINSSDPDGWAPGHAGPTGLYWLFWRLRGEACAVKAFVGQGASTQGEDAQQDKQPAFGAAGRAMSGGPPVRVHSPSVHGLIGRLWNRPAAAVRTGSSMQGGFAVVARRVTARAAVAATAGLEPGTRPAAGAVAHGHKGPGQPPGDGGAGMAWSQLQVGCNVSVAGSDGDGGAWWRFHCGLISTAGSSLTAAAHATTAGQRHTSRAHSGRPQQEPQQLQQQPASDSNSRQGGLSRAKPASPKGPEPSQQGPGRGLHQDPDPDPAQGSEYATCGPAVQGPLLVVVLERVQSGLLGAALSAFGITGLYFSVVFGIGRFLRLTVSNIRLRIAYEDFPSTQRLVAMVQDIYIARAEGELQLEEELFYLLLKIYKTPKLLNELTRLSQQ